MVEGLAHLAADGRDGMDWEGLAALANKALASLAKLLQAEDLHAADAHRLAFAMLGVAPLHHCQAGSLPRARVSLTLRLICGYCGGLYHRF